MNTLLMSMLCLLALPGLLYASDQKSGDAPSLLQNLANSATASLGHLKTSTVATVRTLTCSKGSQYLRNKRDGILADGSTQQLTAFAEAFQYNTDQLKSGEGKEFKKRLEHFNAVLTSERADTSLPAYTVDQATTELNTIKEQIIALQALVEKRKAPAPTNDDKKIK